MIKTHKVIDIVNLKVKIKSKEEIKVLFKAESGIEWKNSQGEPDIDYVEWLENRLVIDLTHQKLVEALKYALIGYEKKVNDHEYEFILEEDFNEIASDIINHEKKLA